MQNWKKAIVFGSIGVGAALVFTRRRPGTGRLVILSGATASRSEAVAESKDPYPLKFVDVNVREFSHFHQHLIFAQLRIEDVLVDENFRSAKLMDANGFHGKTPATI